MSISEPSAGRIPEPLSAQLDRLIANYRRRCLWFLRENYYPVTRDEILRVLGYIERYGDREAYRRASAIRRWLSQNSSAPSVGS